MAVPLYKDLFERHMDHLITSTLAGAFKSEMLKTVKYLLKSGHSRNQFTPPAYHAFLRTIDNACFSIYYEMTGAHDDSVSEQISRNLTEAEVDLPNSEEIFLRAKELFLQVRFSTDINKITRWILEMQKLVPEIDFMGHAEKIVKDSHSFFSQSSGK